MQMATKVSAPAPRPAAAVGGVKPPDSKERDAKAADPVRRSRAVAPGAATAGAVGGGGGGVGGMDGGLLSTMEDILEKLKICDYEIKFCADRYAHTRTDHPTHMMVSDYGADCSVVLIDVVTCDRSVAYTLRCPRNRQSSGRISVHSVCGYSKNSTYGMRQCRQCSGRMVVATSEAICCVD